MVMSKVIKASMTVGSARISAICSGVPLSPAKIAAGPPDAKRSMRNTNSATIPKTGTVATILRMRKVYMAVLPPVRNRGLLLRQIPEDQERAADDI